MSVPPKSKRLARAKALFPPGQVLRYLAVGVGNTAFGYASYVAALFLLNRFAPAQTAGVTLTQTKLAAIASILSTPLNITVSYLNYKLFVFQTKGNYVREWLKAFSVYGVSNLIGLLALSALTRFIEAMLHGYSPFGKGTPGYVAGALMTSATTIISFIGHKKVTFGGAPGATEDAEAYEVASAKLENTPTESLPQ